MGVWERLNMRTSSERIILYTQLLNNATRKKRAARFRSFLPSFLPSSVGRRLPYSFGMGLCQQAAIQPAAAAPAVRGPEAKKKKKTKKPGGRYCTVNLVSKIVRSVSATREAVHLNLCALESVLAAG